MSLESHGGKERLPYKNMFEIVRLLRWPNLSKTDWIWTKFR